MKKRFVLQQTERVLLELLPKKVNMLTPKQTINCRGQLLILNEPVVMGILNITPDSFYDGGKFNSLEKALAATEQMLEAGAKIIDIGGMSSRPGAEMITVEEELRRVLPIVEAVHKTFPTTLLSVDTIRAKVVRAAVEAGAHIVNDISAGRQDEALYATVAELQVPYILMHMKGTPKTMQLQPQYDDVVQVVLDFLIQEYGKLRALGVKDVLVDPGFGFGKTLIDNYRLLKYFHVFKILDVPLLAGLSRKSMIYKYLNITPSEALNGTTALHMVALQQGAKILRVHDVKAAMETIRLWQQLEQID